MTDDFEIGPSAKAKARDFIDNEKQFQLGFLPTEQSKGDEPSPVQIALGHLRKWK